MKTPIQKIVVAPRQINANWTVDIEEELTTVLGNEIQLEIDQSIINEFLFADRIKLGWTRVDFDGYLNHTEVTEWANKTLAGGYLFAISKVAFEFEKDAVVFRLKWL